MRYFILSDVHANLEALEAVLADLEQQRAVLHPVASERRTDRLIFLGDAIGYMPNPNEVMDRLWPLADVILPGNHELGAWQILQGLGDPPFNPLAVAALRWTAQHLTEANRGRLRDLVEGRQYVRREGAVLFTHSSPSHAELFLYIESLADARGLFFDDPPEGIEVAFAGHTHLPQFYWTQTAGQPGQGSMGGIVGRSDYTAVPRSPSSARQPRSLEARWCLDRLTPALAVVPSIGQPRDHMTQTGYAIYDDATRDLVFRRVPYPLTRTVARMRELGFDPRLSIRLMLGV